MFLYIYIFMCSFIDTYSNLFMCVFICLNMQIRWPLNSQPLAVHTIG